MKLVIMIPCLNEETTLPLVLATIPKKIAGIDSIQLLIIDDGCTDDTINVAKSFGITEFVTHRRNHGLSRSFRHGLNRSLELGADIIVLTEGDNQYKQERIPELIAPILDGRADLVIADRMTATVADFSATKKVLQRFGTWVLNKAAGTQVPDAISGFRAYSRDAAIQISPVADYSWATETTIQAAMKKQSIVIVPIPTNPKLRESRQFKSSWQHIRRSSITIVRAYIMHRPYAVFGSLGGLFLVLGLLPFGHLLYLILTTEPNAVYGPHHIQSLLTGSVLLIASFIAFTLGIIADLIRINRLLIEDSLEIAKRDHLRALATKKSD
jgi:glycosyltransferase involved in cell wall biosynthesis